ncbi:MAG: VWA domain-containing protein [Deltaproteobacteria bacterium]|nr:VWA domain-containing protein [Deltaproteobacteria bacterium]
MKKLTFIFSMLFVVAAPIRVYADNCSVPKVLIVLDKSSSMNNTINGDSKWNLAKAAIANLVNAYDDRIDFGLMIYPGTNHCTTGIVTVDVGPGNASSIISALGDAPPSGGNYTPIYQSLDAVGSYSTLMDATSENYVIFLTDGWQWCDPYDASTRFNGVDSVYDLHQLGIRSAIIGFSAGVDAVALHRMAYQSDMVRTGCDENATFTYVDGVPIIDDPDKRCYYQSNDGPELQAVLDSIGAVITAEVCDGIDNNCDGNIDEGLYRACTSICGGGVEECVLGNWENCSAQQPEAERCDDVDNNCDGVIDEGCTCVNGETRPCGIATGLCSMGEQVCENGYWTECRNAVWPTEETCNGIDDDCDGFIDEDIVETCETVCGNGVSVCVAGDWTDCDAPVPVEESCNGFDDDCDGIVDNGDNLCDSGKECIEGICVDENGNTDNDAGVEIPVNNGSDSDSDGCGCSHAGSSRNKNVFWLSLLLGFAVFFRRRKF